MDASEPSERHHRLALASALTREIRREHVLGRRHG